MNRSIWIHIGIWCGFMALDYAMYIPVWHSQTLLIGLVNYLWFVISFYSTWYIVWSDLNRKQDNTIYALGKKNIFWILTIIAGYITATYIGDKYFFDSYYSPSIWSYCLARFNMVSHYILGGVMIAGFYYQRKNNQFLHAKRVQLEERMSTLEAREMQLEARIATKESENMRLNEENGELQFNKEMLLRDLVALEEAVARHEARIAELVNTINNYKAEGEQQKEDNELLRLNSISLEQEISEKQNLVLVLKAELLASAEEYKQLTLRYSRKFDFYNRKLTRYETLYGKLDSDDE